MFLIPDGIAIGWFLVLAGAVLLLAEAYNPGFFLAVPGTAMVILGILSLLFPGFFSSVWLVVVGVAVALLDEEILGEMPKKELVKEVTEVVKEIESNLASGMENPEEMPEYRGEQ